MITVELLEKVPDLSESPWLLIPRSIDDWHQSYRGLDLTGVSAVREITALNSEQHAYLLKPRSTRPPGIQFLIEKSENRPPDWFWQQPSARYTRASEDLIELTREMMACCEDQGDSVRRLMEHAAKLFGYGHRDRPLYDQGGTISCLCGVTQGSCVDINTYLMAAACSLDIPVQYMAGYWFHPDKNATSDMHCWLVFEINDQPVFWDLAHHLKWGANGLAPGLNPAGGRRVTMSCGRGLLFETPNGVAEISHFSEPVWILPGSRVQSTQLRISIKESA